VSAAGADARRRAPWLAVLLLLFGARVLGQALVAFGGVTFLPPMEQWQSGLLPYGVLLAAQVVLLFVMARIVVDFARGSGWTAVPRRGFGAPLVVAGWLYLVAMVVRYPIQMALNPDDRWFGRVIPIPFHWVLATFLLLFASWHARHAPRAKA
jgi:uncharacterized protein